MSDEHAPDLRLVVATDRLAAGPLRVLHPCRCDAPDPEAMRMEPLDVPLEPLRAAGRALVVCPECDARVLVVAAGQGDAPEAAPAALC